jgi:alkylation response protein AidB-like acyl-CoA dehydrogenase
VAAFVVESGMTGMQVRNQPTQSGEAVCKVTFDSVQVGAEARVGDGASIWAEWEIAVSEANISNAALAIGSATRIHELATEYSKVREAFGQPIGGFQAIAHYLADSLVEIEGTRTLVYQAAWARDNGHDFVQLAAMAKMQACDVFARTTSKAVQIHGGLGCTMEADPQLYYRRAKQQQLMYWDPAYLEDKIATLIFGEIEAV